MSQTQAAPQPAPTPAPPSADRGAVQDAGQGTPGTRTRSVPALLTRLQGIGVLATLLFGLATGGLLFGSWRANEAAADNTAQLARVQNIASGLFRADALASNAFLIGGLEPAKQRQAYDDSLAEVSALIAEAADAQPADRQVLVDLNREVLAYAETVQQARTYNRQNLPVGAQYQREASASLRADAVPMTLALANANRARAQDEMAAQRPGLLALATVATLLALLAINQRLATQFRRRVNLGVLAAAVLVAAVGTIAALSTQRMKEHNTELSEGAFAAADDTATARSAANDARSNEALRLIARGSGQQFENQWTAAAAVVDPRLRNVSLLEPWSGYKERHAEIVQLDEAGRYEAAVAAATAPGEDGATGQFDTFDATAQQVVDENTKAATSRLRSGNSLVLTMALLAGLGGLAAAAAVSWGIGRRRKEYL